MVHRLGDIKATTFHPFSTIEQADCLACPLLPYLTLCDTANSNNYCQTTRSWVCHCTYIRFLKYINLKDNISRGCKLQCPDWDILTKTNIKCILCKSKRYRRSGLKIPESGHNSWFFAVFSKGRYLSKRRVIPWTVVLHSIPQKIRNYDLFPEFWDQTLQTPFFIAECAYTLNKMLVVVGRSWLKQY